MINDVQINVPEEAARKSSKVDPAEDTPTCTPPEARTDSRVKLKASVIFGMPVISATVLATILLVTNGTAMANGAAMPGAEFVQLQNEVTKLCLDSDSDENVYPHDCNAGDYQKWYTIRTGVGVGLRNVATGLCLDSNTNQRVYTHDCNDGDYQIWFTGLDRTLRNVATGLCLDSDGGGIDTRDCNNGYSQKWSKR